jgi:chitinase
MRRLWWITGCLLIAVSPLWAGSVMLQWNLPTTNTDSTPLTDLGHIDVFYGTSSGSYTQHVNAGLTTSASIAGLAEGMTWFFAVVAVDTSNNDSVFSNEVSAIPRPSPPSDTIPPTVNITSPAPGAVPRRSAVTITANAADNVGVTRVEFSINGSLQCADGSAPYSCPWTVPPANNRVYQLQAKAFDAAGNMGASSIVEVVAQ